MQLLRAAITLPALRRPRCALVPCRPVLSPQVPLATSEQQNMNLTHLIYSKSRNKRTSDTVKPCPAAGRSCRGSAPHLQLLSFCQSMHGTQSKTSRPQPQPVALARALHPSQPLTRSCGNITLSSPLLLRLLLLLLSPTSFVATIAAVLCPPWHSYHPAATADVHLSAQAAPCPLQVLSFTSG